MTGYVALGSNLGDRRENLAAGLAGMAARGIEPRAVSSVWETEAVGEGAGGPFLNMVARVEVDAAPLTVLNRLLEIERQAGRVRGPRNAPRELDLDLLWLDGVTLDGPRLILPHPRMWRRRFVLAPLAELAPGLREPRSGRTVRELLSGLEPRPWVRRLGVLAAPSAANL